jgi:hypothetical protein
LTFTSPTTYTDGSTSTALAASATGSKPYPTAETLTATVAPSGTTGTVEFADKGTNLGSPVTVSSGSAVLHLDGAAGDPAVPTVGAHSYTATFTPNPATQNGVAFSASTSAAQTLTVTRTTPMVTLGASATSLHTNQTETLTATVKLGVAGSVTFYSGTTALNSTPDLVGAAPNNVATYAAQFAAANYSFTAKFTPTDTTDYGSATSNTEAVSVTTGLISQTITFTSKAPANAVLGGTYTVAAKGGASGNPVVFSSGTAKTCKVVGAKVTFLALGTCTVDANQAGNAGYAAAPQAKQSVVVKKSQAITFTSKAPANAVVGGTYTVAATGGASGNPVVFSSGTAKTCKVVGAKVTFLALGTCTVDANQAGNAGYAAAPQAKQSMVVK